MVFKVVPCETGPADGSGAGLQWPESGADRAPPSEPMAGGCCVRRSDGDFRSYGKGTATSVMGLHAQAVTRECYEKGRNTIWSLLSAGGTLYTPGPRSRLPCVALGPSPNGAVMVDEPQEHGNISEGFRVWLCGRREQLLSLRHGKKRPFRTF